MLLSQYLTAPVISTILIKMVELVKRQMKFCFDRSGIPESLSA
jgi:hypothetical protein